MTPVAPGIAVITCTSADIPSVQATCRITVHAEQKFTLPASLTLIYADAFNSISAQEIVVPEGVTAIGNRAFANGDELVFVHLPDSLVAIASDAFSGSKNVMFICSDEGCSADYAASHGITIIQE